MISKVNSVGNAIFRMGLYSPNLILLPYVKFLQGISLIVNHIPMTHGMKMYVPYDGPYDMDHIITIKHFTRHLNSPVGPACVFIPMALKVSFGPYVYLYFVKYLCD